MNERIQKLIEQATSTQGPTPYNPLTFEVFDKEKFAQLIVRECVEQIINRERSNGEWYQDDIFKHFGVEE